MTTVCPRSARQTPLTRPAYPAPKNATRAMPGYFAFKGFSPFAIAIMVSFERLSSSELTTQ
jgi:hypothetical protein